MKHSPPLHPSNKIEASAQTVVCISGANTFNNEVLSNFLESKTGMPCRCVQNSQLPSFYDQLAGYTVLIFLDCTTTGTPQACEQACIEESVKHECCMVVCFNVPLDENAETLALKQGVKGILYDHQPVDLYPRAARAVLDGELWFSREVLENHLMIDNVPAGPPDNKNNELTRREREILSFLASGMRNRDIADKLFISPHTVKTHAYNLYKKIDVNNRFEAAQWLIGNGQVR